MSVVKNNITRGERGRGRGAADIGRGVEASISKIV